MKDRRYVAFPPFYSKIKSITCNMLCLPTKLPSLLQFGPLKYGRFLYTKPYLNMLFVFKNQSSYIEIGLTELGLNCCHSCLT